MVDSPPSSHFHLPTLSAYLASEIPDLRSVVAVERLSGGMSNPTFVITAETVRGLDRFVLRSRPHGELHKMAHRIDREVQVMRALRKSKVPVPNVLLFCEDAGVMGVPFYLMQFLDGRIFRDARLPGIAVHERAAIYGDFSRVLARLHQVDPDAVC